MSNQKGLAPILIVLLIAVLGVGGYFVYTSLRGGVADVAISPSGIPAITTVPTSSSNPDETANWKTYTDTKQKFSIKYPPAWTVFPNIVGGIIPGFDGTIINSANKLEPHGEILAEEGQAGISINVVGTDKLTNETLLNYHKRKFSSPDKGGNDYTETTLNTIPAIKHVRTTTEPDSGQIIYLVSNREWVYWLNVSVHNTSYQKIVDQILSTFKFTP